MNDEFKRRTFEYLNDHAEEARALAKLINAAIPDGTPYSLAAQAFGMLVASATHQAGEGFLMTLTLCAESYLKRMQEKAN